MPIDASFKAAINVLAELASDNHPSYVRVNAAGRLASLLSPANPKHNDIVYDLNGKPDNSHSPEPPSHETPGEHIYACYLRDREDDEEDDDPSSATEDEPP